MIGPKLWCLFYSFVLVDRIVDSIVPISKTDGHRWIRLGCSNHAKFHYAQWPIRLLCHPLRVLLGTLTITMHEISLNLRRQEISISLMACRPSDGDRTDQRNVPAFGTWPIECMLLNAFTIVIRELLHFSHCNGWPLRLRNSWENRGTSRTKSTKMGHIRAM